MPTRKFKLKALIPDDRNANKGTVRGQMAINQSIQNLKAGRSILIDRNNRIIAGNKTRSGALEAGIEDVLIVETTGDQLVAVKRTDIDLDSPAGRELALADNRTAELNLDWDDEAIAAIVADFAVDTSHLWDDTDLLPKKRQKRQAEDEETANKVIDQAIAAPPRVKPGDVWLLGEHRLVCGDCTNAETIERLMVGRMADACVTDPPYNVDYDPEARGCSFSDDRKANPLGKIENDQMGEQDFAKFLGRVYDTIADVLAPGCPLYVFHSDMMGHHFRAGFVNQGQLALKSCLVWVKNHFTLGQKDYHWMHEPILYGWKEGASHRYYGDRKQTTVLAYNPPHYDKGNCDTDGYIHSCQKPTPLLERLLENSTREGDLVFEPFAGSGSTLIAADRINRVCYAAELDPRFASAIVARWESFTGQQAVLTIENTQQEKGGKNA